MVTFRVRSVAWFLTGLVLAVGMLWTTGRWRAEALPGPAESTVVSVTPTRVLDTRDPVNLGLAGPFTSPTGQKLQITGAVPTPAGTQTVVPDGATGVLMNVTVVGPTANGFLSVRPGDATGAPTTSSLNFAAGQTVPNSVQVSLPTSGANAGQIDIVYDALGQAGPITDVLIDVVAYTSNTGLQDLTTQLGLKADTADVYTKAQVDAAIAAVPAGPQGPAGVQGPAGPGAPQAGDNCTIDGLAGTIVAGWDERGSASQKCFRGVVSTLAGTPALAGDADGTHTDARIFGPQGVAVASDGTVYVGDTFNHRIRRITPDGTVTTLAGSTAGFNDGDGSAAQFNFPAGIDVAPDGTIYAADIFNNRIRAITPTGSVSTLAGSGTAGSADGTGAAAQFNGPIDVAVAPDGTIYVAERDGNRIRAITPAGVVTTLAGSTAGFADGTGAAAQFNGPAGITVAPDGTIYVADRINHRIRAVTPAGVVTTLAGSTSGYVDDTGAAAKFFFPTSVDVAPDGTIVVGDDSNQRVRRVSAAGTVTTIAGSSQAFLDGVGTNAQFFTIQDVAVANDGTIYVADSRSIRRID